MPAALDVLLLFGIMPHNGVIWQWHDGGAPIRIRTEDPFITNEVLYQLSYWGNAKHRLNDEAPTCNSN